MRVNQISVLIGGEAGAGIFRSGFLFAKTCMRGGLYVFGTNDYQSLIRGGHNFYVARVDSEDVYSQADDVDLLIALNAETVMLHRDELVPGGGIMYDQDDIDLGAEKLGREDLKLYPIPLRKIVWEELKEQPIMRNTVALGAAFALLDYDLALLEGVLRDTFKAEVAEANIKAAKRGHEYVKENFEGTFEYRLGRRKGKSSERIFASGNETIGLGAVRAGCKFYSAYPMTPSTGVLHFLAANERENEMIVIQPEGEIAAVNMAAGAAFAGARAMTSTSGGGFCLMSEGLGMASMTETSVVIMVAVRPGPSTGLPTYSGQGDLRFVIHASQGEFPRVVIAPGDIEECFYETVRAFNLAEKYQIPVIILIDKYLAESQRSVQPFDLERIRIERGDLIPREYKNEEPYKRHRFTDSGISPRAFPLTNGAIVRTNADEHDELGYTSEDPEIATRMCDKRMRKLDYLTKELAKRDVKTVKFYGPEEAAATIIAWGSTKGPVREAMKLLRQEGVTVNFLQILYLLPFPVNSVKEALGKARKSIVVESNKTSQLSSLIREHLLRDVDHKILKYDGRPFDPRYLAEKIKEVL
ncbi:MAG: 2-oxoacid:acceptor oxidoreductase subunit alpha [Candidatus Bathyarchaeota archaeon]|nr:2-oxoacid:acceptor oxidoreductase subunit alpha [Candidatus Bathyarchaeota archaeon]